MKTSGAVFEPLAPVSNGAAPTIDASVPYAVSVTVEGTAAILFHAYNVESVAAKGAAAKGSAAKKGDDIESYVYRGEGGELCIPGEHFRMSIVTAAKSRQDPRSPRKSAMDLFKAGIVVLEEFCPLGTKTWDYLDQRRAVVQRNAITRTRPAMRAGWRVSFTIQVLLPEYISPAVLNEVLQAAGRLCGVGDFRPTYGRFHIVRFEHLP